MSDISSLKIFLQCLTTGARLYCDSEGYVTTNPLGKNECYNRIIGAASNFATNSYITTDSVGYREGTLHFSILEGETDKADSIKPEPINIEPVKTETVKETCKKSKFSTLDI